jgi:hypothetical protein
LQVVELAVGDAAKIVSLRVVRPEAQSIAGTWSAGTQFAVMYEIHVARRKLRADLLSKLTDKLCRAGLPLSGFCSPEWKRRQP